MPSLELKVREKNPVPAVNLQQWGRFVVPLMQSVVPLRKLALSCGIWRACGLGDGNKKKEKKEKNLHPTPHLVNHLAAWLIDLMIGGEDVPRYKLSITTLNKFNKDKEQMAGKFCPICDRWAKLGSYNLKKRVYFWQKGFLTGGKSELQYLKWPQFYRIEWGRCGAPVSLNQWINVARLGDFLPNWTILLQIDKKNMIFGKGFGCA